MSCNKLAYDSCREANEVINKARKKRYSNGVRRKRGPKKIPKRPYKCKECGKWHLTSQKTNSWKD